MSPPLADRRIGLVTASASRLGGGVFEAVVAQAALIRSLGGEVRVFALTDAYSSEDAVRFAAGEVTLCAVTGPVQIGFSSGLVGAMLDAELDCLHLHGIWLYPTRSALLWARRTKRRLIVSPHGMLDPWIIARGKWKKALARLGYLRASWRIAGAIHALTATEAADIKRESGRSDALVIPNPAPEHPDLAEAERPPFVVFIGRIHPKKNLLALIEGWQQARLGCDAQLLIAGWGESGDVARLEAAVAAAGPAVRFLGPVYGKAKQDLLDCARFTVLPSFGEGLPMAVLEGWSAGTPAILSANCNLPEGFVAGAALECGHSSAAIARALRLGLALDLGAWQAMSRAAQQLARGPFSQEQVAARWAAVYGQDS